VQADQELATPNTLIVLQGEAAAEAEAQAARDARALVEPCSRSSDVHSVVLLGILQQGSRRYRIPL